VAKSWELAPFTEPTTTDSDLGTRLRLDLVAKAVDFEQDRRGDPAGEVHRPARGARAGDLSDRHGMDWGGGEQEQDQRDHPHRRAPPV
jgi:hypothetical protein